MPKRASKQSIAERDLLEVLSAGLSDNEMQRTLAGALMTLEQKDLDRLVAKLGPETGGTLKELLASRGKSPKGKTPIVGSAKVRQEWERTWSDWWDCVSEAGLENGKYVEQEHHWEPPYLDIIALAADLEPIAAKIGKLIRRVFDEDLDPDLSMAEVFEETIESVGRARLVHPRPALRAVLETTTIASSG